MAIVRKRLKRLEGRILRQQTCLKPIILSGICPASGECISLAELPGPSWKRQLQETEAEFKSRFDRESNYQYQR